MAIKRSFHRMVCPEAEHVSSDLAIEVCGKLVRGAEERVDLVVAGNHAPLGQRIFDKGLASVNNRADVNATTLNLSALLYQMIGNALKGFAETTVGWTVA